MEEAEFWKVERKTIRCFACFRNCLFSKSDLGFCRVRKKVRQKLYALNYGKVFAEKKVNVEGLPFYHFFPGSKFRLLSVLGTNFKGAIGFEAGYEKRLSKIKEKDPEELVKSLKKKVDGIALGGDLLSEPFVYPEFAYALIRNAKKENLKTAIITNGFGNKEVVKKISKYLDGALILLHSFGDPEFYRKHAEVKQMDALFKTIKQFKKQRVFLEFGIYVTDAQDVERSKNFAIWLTHELSAEIPVHLLVSPIPYFKVPLSFLEECAEELKRRGLRYVYIPQFPHSLNHTYCYNCFEKVIEREADKLKNINLVRGRCPNCGFRINLKTE